MGIANNTSDEFIKTHRETFRAEATDALRLFTPKDREKAISFETKHTNTDKLLKAWFEQIQPMYIDLDQNRDNVKIKKILVQTLGYKDSDADKTLDYLIDNRKESLLNEVLNNLYPVENGMQPEQRQNAYMFLSEPDTEIDGFFSRYIDFVHAVETAKKYNVLLCDPHSSWLERQKTAMQINKERQRLSQNEDTRLEEIEYQIGKITKDPDSLVGKILSKNWNFITLLDLRSKYQRHIDSLSREESKNPNKKLKIFERVTQSFRDREAEKLSKNNKTQSLKALRKINEEIYDLLLEIFDLDDTKRNRLLLDIQRHTRLSQERDLILLIQRNRQHFLTKKDS